MSAYVYSYKDNLYLNITNRCTNACVFCLKNKKTGVGNYDLRLSKDAEFSDVLTQLNDIDLSKYNECVFCGFGEPTLNMQCLIKLAVFLKKKGKIVRLNTNGQANLYHKADITPELQGLIDIVSISLNAPDAKEYQELSNSIYGENAYAEVLDFAKKCKKYIPRVIFTVVDMISENDIQKCRQTADELGVEFRVRKYLN